MPTLPSVESPFFVHFFGPEVMTSQPEVTTFWDGLGSFGGKTVILPSRSGVGCNGAGPVVAGRIRLISATPGS